MEKAVHTLKVNPELLNLLPELKKSELENLEQSLLAEGCREPVLVWNETIVDGHNRYSLCHQHKIPFSIASVEFEDLDHAKMWILKNQLSRRNLEPAQRLAAVEAHRDLLKKLAKDRHQEAVSKGGQTAGKGRPKNSSPQNFGESYEEPTDNRAGEVNQQIANLAGLSHEQVRKYNRVMEEGTEDVKQRMLSGKKTKDNPNGLSISAAYDTLRHFERLQAANSEAAQKTLKAASDMEPLAITGIKKASTMNYVVEWNRGNPSTVTRQKLFEHGYKKCVHCSGYGVVEKND